MRESSKEMAGKVQQFIERHSNGAPEVPHGDAEFDSLALELFKFQMQYNEPYRKYAMMKRATAFTVRNWSAIPPVPIQAFKNAVLSCEPPEEAEAVFMTSGTTDPQSKGRQYHPMMKVWNASMSSPFKQYVLPDSEKMTMFVLSPGRELNENSSLSRYLTLAVEQYGAEDSRYFFKEQGLLMEELNAALGESESQAKPVLLLGATFAYVHFLDYCSEQGLRFNLPPGSRILDTGGFKGQSREVEMERLYEQFRQFFAVPRHFCVNMYGMTELCSQFYDQTIYTYVTCGKANFKKNGPAWLRTSVLDPETLEPVGNGRKGVLAHLDLANWNSCAAILTEDLGVRYSDGFELLGRIKGSEARGCSLAVDQFLSTSP